MEVVDGDIALLKEPTDDHVPRGFALRLGQLKSMWSQGVFGPAVQTDPNDHHPLLVHLIGIQKTGAEEPTDMNEVNFIVATVMIANKRSIGRMESIPAACETIYA